MTLLGIGAPTKPVPAEPEQRHKDYYYAYRMYQDSLYDLAAAEFLDFVDKNPGNANCSEALFLAGESLYRTGAYDRARAVYLRCAIEYPGEAGDRCLVAGGNLLGSDEAALSGSGRVLPGVYAGAQ